MKHALQWLKTANATFLEKPDILKSSCKLLAYIYGVATVQNLEHDWEDVLSNKNDRNCDDRNLHEFLLLDFFSQLITVILVEKHDADNDVNSGSICDCKFAKEDCSNCDNLVIKTQHMFSAEPLLSDSYNIVFRMWGFEKITNFRMKFLTTFINLARILGGKKHLKARIRICQ